MGLAKEKYQSSFGTTEFSKSKSQSGIPNAYTRSWRCNSINNHIFIIVAYAMTHIINIEFS
jgi:hypothetical protein